MNWIFVAIAIAINLAAVKCEFNTTDFYTTAWNETDTSTRSTTDTTTRSTSTTTRSTSTTTRRTSTTTMRTSTTTRRTTDSTTKAEVKSVNITVDRIQDIVQFETENCPNCVDNSVFSYASAEDICRGMKYLEKCLIINCQLDHYFNEAVNATCDSSVKRVQDLVLNVTSRCHQCSGTSSAVQLSNGLDQVCERYQSFRSCLYQFCYEEFSADEIKDVATICVDFYMYTSATTARTSTRTTTSYLHRVNYTSPSLVSTVGSTLTHIQDFVRAVSYRCPICYASSVLSSTTDQTACMELDYYKACLNANCYPETYSDDIKDASSICERFQKTDYGHFSGATTLTQVHWMTSLVLLQQLYSVLGR